MSSAAFNASLLALLALSGGQPDTSQNIEATAYFSPNGGATEAVTKEIKSAQKSVLVMAYSFTNPQILKALADAKARGVDVQIVLDKSNATAKYSGATYMTNAGVPTYIDRNHAIMHNKVMILDEKTVITGSFNFTKAADEKNAENLLVLRSPSLASTYRKEWERHRGHSNINASRFKTQDANKNLYK